MFDGECASLSAIYNTQTVCVPQPIKVLQGVVTYVSPVKVFVDEIKIFDQHTFNHLIDVPSQSSCLLNLYDVAQPNNSKEQGRYELTRLYYT